MEIIIVAIVVIVVIFLFLFFGVKININIKEVKTLTAHELVVKVKTYKNLRKEWLDTGYTKQTIGPFYMEKFDLSGIDVHIDQKKDYQAFLEKIGFQDVKMEDIHLIGNLRLYWKGYSFSLKYQTLRYIENIKKTQIILPGKNIVGKFIFQDENNIKYNLLYNYDGETIEYTTVITHYEMKKIINYPHPQLSFQKVADDMLNYRDDIRY